jgi:hypothetical protein
MKSKVCPYRRLCCDSGNCETCDFGKAFINLSNKIKSLKAKNKLLQEENEKLKDKLEILTNPNF